MRHQNVCGLKFQCGECPGEYGSLETLQTHCRRKRHSLGKEVLDRIMSKKKEKGEKEGKILGDIRVSSIVDCYTGLPAY